MEPNFVLFLWILLISETLRGLMWIGKGLVNAEKETSTHYNNAHVVSGFIVLLIVTVILLT